MSRPILPALLALLSAAACAGAVSACGESEESGPDAATIAQQALGPDARSAGSGRLSASFALDAREVARHGGPVAIELSGPFSGAERRGLPRLDFRLTGEFGKRRVRAGAVSTGERVFVRLQGRVYEVGERLVGRLRSALDLLQGGRALSLTALGIAPSAWIDDPRLVGTETVGGVQARHVTGGLDVDQFLEDVDTLLGRGKLLSALLPFPTPDRLSAAAHRRIAEAIRDARVDVWAGERDGILRRLKVTAGVGRNGRLAFDLLVADVGRPQDIRAPENARPLSELAGGGLPGSLAEPSP